MLEPLSMSRASGLIAPVQAPPEQQLREGELRFTHQALSADAAAWPETLRAAP